MFFFKNGFIYIYTYIYIYIHIYTYIYTYIYTHAYIYMRPHSSIFIHHVSFPCLCRFSPQLRRPNLVGMQEFCLQTIHLKKRKQCSIVLQYIILQYLVVLKKLNARISYTISENFKQSNLAMTNHRFLNIFSAMFDHNQATCIVQLQNPTMPSAPFLNGPSHL
jgi:hypothetical protein